MATLILEAGDDIFAAAALAHRAVELEALGKPADDDPPYLAKHRRDFLYIAERLRGLADQLDPKAVGQAIELARKADR
jgi:hypothetical protein